MITRIPRVDRYLGSDEKYGVFETARSHCLSKNSDQVVVAWLRAYCDWQDG